MFSSTTCLTVVFSCGMAPAPYFRRRTVRDHSLLFFTFVLYYIYSILPLLLFVIVCRACPSPIVARPGGGDGFFISSVEDTVLELGGSGVLLLQHRVRSPWQTPIIYYIMYITVM